MASTTLIRQTCRHISSQLPHPATAQYTTKVKRTRLTFPAPSQWTTTSMCQRHHSTTTTTPNPPLPTPTWDSHMHIISPDTITYPLSKSTTYTPAPHTLTDMTNFYTSLTQPSPTASTNQTTQAPQINPVFIQPSPYGTDNSLLLAALQTLNNTTTSPAGSSTRVEARGIVVIDPHNPPLPAKLRIWHSQGVRGVRINLVSINRTLTAQELSTELQLYAEIIAPLNLGWVLQLYISMDMLPALLTAEQSLALATKGVRIVLDHMGSPTLPASRRDGSGGIQAVQPEEIAGFRALLEMIERGNTYVKISAPYRLTRSSRVNDPDDLDGLVKALLMAKGGSRCIWASDWPHTRFENKGVDVGKWVERCWGLVGEAVLEVNAGKGTEKERVEEEVRRRGEMLFYENARELWG